MAASNLGATLSASRERVTFRVLAPRATRVELWLYDAPTGRAPLLRQAMDGPADGVFSLALPFQAGATFYGYRAWGPNWPWDPAWTPGSATGFVADVDRDGNRFNPNKLLLDPYALEVSHCVQTPEQPDRTPYSSGPASRTADTGPFAPKGIVLASPAPDFGTKPAHAFRDDVIYEVHLRGLTRADPAVPDRLRGTYAGAALRAPYLAALGVTAVEFLPVHQMQNALNDLPRFAADHNYWGYASMSWMAPDRRYSSDPSPGGPTREWVAMVKAFHDAGIKVFIDMVYNHHEEGGVDATGAVGSIYSLRGLDNPGFYELAGPSGPPGAYRNDNGVGPNLNAANGAVRDLVLASLRHWSDVLGVDGFRFDLAAVLGNGRAEGGFAFDADDPDNILNRAVRLLPARPADGGPGVDLIAEPYTADAEGQDQGRFPAGWSEWNDRFRDAVRASQNKLGFVPVTPGALAVRVAGSDDLFRANGRKPWNSVNYVVSHDGFTLQDLHSFSGARNVQAFPFGPSPSGRSAADEMCWDHGGDPVAQGEAVRLSLALLLLAAGVPMLTGGTEWGRTQYGNNNPFNLDTSVNWLDWSLAETNAALLGYTRALVAFRRAHAALRPREFFTGTVQPRSGIKDLTWFRADGAEIDARYFGDTGSTFLGWQLDGTVEGDVSKRIFIGYNSSAGPVSVRLPSLPGTGVWRLVLDTSRNGSAWGKIHSGGQEPVLSDCQYWMEARSCMLAIR